MLLCKLVWMVKSIWALGYSLQEWLQQKKKVGRPITYNGDPNAPELTEAERRRVKRRIANRESARRVQQRRKEMIDELQHKVWAASACIRIVWPHSETVCCLDCSVY